jgi:hypothetical protein
MKAIGLGWVAGMLAAACVRADNVKPYPLYDEMADLSHGAATLIGDVEEFDGESVSAHGHRFSVLPGCHTVTNITTWGGMDPNAAVMAHLPQMPFSIDMKPGLTYVLRIAIVGPVQEGGRLKITLREQDDEGNVLREIGPGGHC